MIYSECDRNNNTNSNSTSNNANHQHHLQTQHHQQSATASPYSTSSSSSSSSSDYMATAGSPKYTTSFTVSSLLNPAIIEESYRKQQLQHQLHHQQQHQLNPYQVQKIKNKYLKFGIGKGTRILFGPI